MKRGGRGEVKGFVYFVYKLPIPTVNIVVLLLSKASDFV